MSIAGTGPTRRVASDRPDRLAWKDRRWEWAGLVPESAQFETKAGIDLEARDRWFADGLEQVPAQARAPATSRPASNSSNGGKASRVCIVPVKLIDRGATPCLTAFLQSPPW
jgi:hypothetical protein